MDERRAAQLGYWEVDRGVFEVVVPRHEITDLAEERHEFPISLLLSALPRALGAGDAPASGNGYGGPGPGLVPAGQGAGGTPGWNPGAGAPRPVRGQLPAAAPQPAMPQPAMAQPALPQPAMAQSAPPTESARSRP